MFIYIYMCVYIWTFCICVLNLSVTSLHCCSDSHPFCCHSLNFRITGAPSRMVLVCDTLGNSSKPYRQLEQQSWQLEQQSWHPTQHTLHLILACYTTSPGTSSSKVDAELLHSTRPTRSDSNKTFLEFPPPPAAVTRVGRAQV